MHGVHGTCHLATAPLAYEGNLLQVLFFSLLGLNLVGKLRFFIYVMSCSLKVWNYILSSLIFFFDLISSLLFPN